MQKNNKKIFDLLQYLIVIFTILECNSIYSQIYGCHLIIRTIFIVSVIIFIFIIQFRKPIKIDKRIIIFIIYDYFCSILMLVNTDSLSGKILVVLVFMLYLPTVLIYLANLSKKEIYDLLNKFVNVVVVMCIVSLTFWFLSSILKILSPTNTVKVVWGKPYSLINSYFGLHFDTQDVWWITGSPIMRNTGIFTEGPMYAVIIIVALIFNNLLLPIEDGKKYKKNIIMFVTMISTISLTGVVCSIIILLNRIKDRIFIMKKNNRKVLLCILVTSCILILLFGINLMIKKLNTSSASHRTLDLQIGIKVFLENPIIGKGINHERGTELDYEKGYGYSNAIIPVLTDGGLILATIYLIPSILLGYKCLRKRKINFCLMLIVYFIILFTTLIQYRLIMLFLISLIYLLTCRDELMEEGEING